jgi:GGDEF domain-containing protein/ribosomal protein L37AE/L43A
MEEEFRDGSRLRCPKCGRTVRHIGVDYDRPAMNLWCEECRANFAEPAILGYCLNCARSFTPDDAQPMLIKEYELTKEGEQAAEEGILPEPGLTEYLKKEFGFYKFEMFREFLRVEVERCNRNAFDSTLGRVRISNLREVVEEGGVARAHRLREEIAILFREMLRESDILTEQGEDEILMILTHTDTEQAEVALKRIRRKSAMQFRKRIEFDHEFLPLRNSTTDVDEILEQIQ